MEKAQVAFKKMSLWQVVIIGALLHKPICKGFFSNIIFK